MICKTHRRHGMRVAVLQPGTASAPPGTDPRSKPSPGLGRRAQATASWFHAGPGLDPTLLRGRGRVSGPPLPPGPRPPLLDPPPAAPATPAARRARGGGRPGAGAGPGTRPLLADCCVRLSATSGASSFAPRTGLRPRVVGWSGARGWSAAALAEHGACRGGEQDVEGYGRAVHEHRGPGRHRL